MRPAAAFATVLAFAVTMSACGGSGESTTADGTYTGADGVTSLIADTSRIVTLSGDLTEILFELGLGENVVGVDITTVHPEAATQLPIVGVGRFLTAEGVLAQQPTLVIGDTQSSPIAAIEQIRGAGIPVVILDVPSSFGDLYGKIEQLGGLLGTPEAAAALAERIRSDVEEALAAVADRDPVRMAYVYTRGPDVTLLFGDGMVTNPLIEGAAGVDTGAEAGVEGTIPLTAEALVAAAPEVIIVPAEGFEILGGIDEFLALPGVAQTPAGRDRRIYAYPEGDFLTFGPRVADSLRLLIEDVHGLP